MMSFLQETHICDEHPSCAVIVCTTDADVVDEAGAVIHPAGTEVWRSCAHESVEVAGRINPDHPHVDRRKETNGD